MGVKSGRPARRADNLTASVNRMSRKCGSLDVSQPYRLPRPVTGIALPFSIFWDVTQCSPLRAGFLIRLLFGSEYEGDMFLLNVGGL
jgi:hypothetical protein